ncbi:MAG: glycosyltransferase family 4 protein [Pleurocapsa sp.]
MIFYIFLTASFILAFICTGWLIQYLGQELLDIPNQRSSHSTPVLRGGGLSFILAFVITASSLIIISDRFPQLFSGWILSDHVNSFIYLCLALIPLTIVGIIDDRQGLPASIRYLVQLLSAGITVACFGTIPLPWLSDWGLVGTIIAVLISLIAITALINFYNFMDGLDGLVAGVTAVQLAFIAFYLKEPIFLLLVTAIAGFLWWNWSPAKIFMGDVGSTVLGASVAIGLLNHHERTIAAWSAFTVILPLIGDCIYTLIRRLIKGENIFQPHRTHIYQRLQQSGLSHGRVAIIYILFTTFLAAIIYSLGVTSIGIGFLLTIVAIAIAELYLQRHKFSIF